MLFYWRVAHFVTGFRHVKVLHTFRSLVLAIDLDLLVCRSLSVLSVGLVVSSETGIFFDFESVFSHETKIVVFFLDEFCMNKNNGLVFEARCE